MSSTNRSNARDSHISDYYATPIDDITLFLNNLKIHTPNVYETLKKGNIIDPCAGGVIGKEPMSYPTALEQINSFITTMDIRNDSPASIKTDFLDSIITKKYDVVITNPPFNLALDIIKKSLEIVCNDGFVIMLLRLNFFGSKQRFPFFQKHMPMYTFVHHKRIKFLKTSNSDSIEYMHCIWQKNQNPKSTQLFLI